MADDFDSGDDLFDDVNPEELVASSKRPSSHHDDGPDKRQKLDQVDRVGLAQRLLREKFGYDNFRHEQEKAIESILRGENTLVIFPTGAGKSLCYQVCHGCSCPFILLTVP